MVRDFIPGFVVRRRTNETYKHCTGKHTYGSLAHIEEEDSLWAMSSCELNGISDKQYLSVGAAIIFENKNSTFIKSFGIDYL